MGLTAIIDKVTTRAKIGGYIALNKIDEFFYTFPDDIECRHLANWEGYAEERRTEFEAGQKDTYQKIASLYDHLGQENKAGVYRKKQP